ncbi:hypothetical protein [Lactobacillus helveticus]|uniref:hypothetical protein n=1 Tax=Lactobacillus helveticus TaxID=1587 RepID=UPI00386C6638
MFLIHKIRMTLKRWRLQSYYKIVYGDKVIFGKNFKSRGNFDLFVENKAKIIFGENVFINNIFSASAQKLIKIGDNCLLGENIKTYYQNHIFKRKDIPINQQGFSNKPVIIGNNSVIGANCLIYKDIPVNSVVKLHENLEIEERI